MVRSRIEHGEEGAYKKTERTRLLAILELQYKLRLTLFPVVWCCRVKRVVGPIPINLRDHTSIFVPDTHITLTIPFGTLIPLLGTLTVPFGTLLPPLLIGQGSW